MARPAKTLAAALLFSSSLAEVSWKAAVQPEEAGCHLLQSTAHARRQSPPQARDVSKGVCRNLTDWDLVTPIKKVVKKYDEDGWCVYGIMGSWASECAVCRQKRDVRSFAKQFAPAYQVYMNSDERPHNQVTLRLPGTDERSVTLRDHTVPLDDLYCYVNGWYSDAQRAQLVSNFSYLEEVSQASCKRLEASLPNYHEISVQDMMVESDRDQTELMKLMNQGGGTLSEDVVKGMLLHAAAKCHLSGTGALCDVANCAARGCMKGDTINYVARGECEDVLG